MKSLFSVEPLPVASRMAAAIVSSRKRVFREETDITPRQIGSWQYIPWGANNQMPYDILDMIEEDETVSTCQQHNIRTLYAGGLIYSDAGGQPPQGEPATFLRHNPLPAYYMGVCTDMRYWGWCVTVLTLTNDGTRIVGLSRREAMYCRLAPADKEGFSPYVLYGNFRKDALTPGDVECIPLLRSYDPLGDLLERMALTPQAIAEGKKPTSIRKFAYICRATTPDTTYYPIPYYASVFKGHWYDIKQLIATAKYAKLKHAAPLKYIIEIEDGYWEKRFDAAGLVTQEEMDAEVQKVKKELVDFLTGAENSGRTLFSSYFIDPQTGHETHEIKITNLDQKKEGGDWESDIQEAINMICFTMGVHSNLVGSVPGNAQSNNSGSDKRELYIIAQCMEQPVREILTDPHRLLIAYNRLSSTDWQNIRPHTPLLQLTTLDQHRDVRIMDN